jgi:hypothetical protein
VRVDYHPDCGPMDTTVTVFHRNRWVGELSLPAARLDHPDDMQDIVDTLTKRGVRAV